MVKKPVLVVVCIGVIAVILALVIRESNLNKHDDINIDISSTLSKAINISELSTAEFKYRGIAEVYKDEERNKLLCQICYNAVVKAGIDLKDFKYEVNDIDKTFIATLPQIRYKVNIIDEQSMAVLPSNAKIEINNMLKYCKEDAEREARESGELMVVAQDNLKATIERLLYPILKSNGYSFIWE